MPNLRFDQLAGAGIAISDGLQRIHERAAALWEPLAIIFDIEYDVPGSGGGMRLYPDRVQYWVSPQTRDRTATVIHELAHAIISHEGSGPRLAPNEPRGPVRRILSDLISIPEHTRVHGLMAEYGVDVVAENQQRSRDFLRDIGTAQIGPDGNNLHLAVGYAMMLTVHRVEALVSQIRRAVRVRSTNVARYGEALAAYVVGERNTTLYEDAVELMRIAEVRPDIRMNVLSQAEYNRQYGAR